MKANFKNPKTGKLYLVSSHRSIQQEGKMVNVDGNGQVLVDPYDGEVLESIPFDSRTDDEYEDLVTKSLVQSEMSESSREKAQAFFKERSKKHTRTDPEARATRISSIKKQTQNQK